MSRQDAAPGSPPASDHHKRVVELIISLTLQIGVITAVVLVVTGTVITFMHHHEYMSDPASLAHLTGRATTHALPGEQPEFPTTFAQMWSGLRAFQGQAVIVLGLMALVATPVLRVAISVFIFLAEKDAIFVGITLLVLALLILSFFLGNAEI